MQSLLAGTADGAALQKIIDEKGTYSVVSYDEEIKKKYYSKGKYCAEDGDEVIGTRSEVEGDREQKQDEEKLQNMQSLVPDISSLSPDVLLAQLGTPQTSPATSPQQRLDVSPYMQGVFVKQNGSYVKVV